MMLRTEQCGRCQSAQNDCRCASPCWLAKTHCMGMTSPVDANARMFCSKVRRNMCWLRWCKINRDLGEMGGSQTQKYHLSSP